MSEQNNRLGLVSVSFRGYSPQDILKAMSHAGLTLIEWGSDIHAPCRDLQRLEELVTLQKQYGISCCSYGTYFRLGETPMEELTDYIKAAKILGTNVLRLWCGSKSGADMDDAEREALLTECVKAASIAKEHDVILCMECHRNTLTQDPKDTLELMQAVNSAHFQMYWQPFQWQETEQNIANAKVIAPYAKRIHVFNWKNDQKLPLSGAVDAWRAYLEQFENPLPLLLEFMPSGTIEELDAEADSLKTIIGETI